MGMNLRYSPLEWDAANNRFDFGSASIINYGSHDYIHNVYHVDPNVTVGGDGKSWAKAFKTIDAALRAATTRNDVVFLAPGDYDEGKVTNITTQGLQLVAVPSNRYQNKAMLYNAGGAAHILTINNHEVVIDGVSISAAADTYDGIQVGTTTACYKVTIQNCRLDGWSGEYGIKAGASNDCPDIVIQNNLFRSWNTSACYMNCTRSAVIGNMFHVVTDKNGLEHIPVGGNRPDNMYNYNTFDGVANSSTTGIKFTGAPNNGTIQYIKNIFTGTWDVSITQIAAAGGCLNYVSDGSGGALIDTVT